MKDGEATAITVIGYVTKDTLIFPRSNWQVLESLGGSLYTVTALASLTEKRVNLVSNAGIDIFDEVMSILAKFLNVDTSGIHKVQQPHYHCYILFASEYGTQYDKNLEVPITFSQVQPFINDSEFILVTSMTGFEFELSTLQQINDTAKCPIYFDYHILALGRDKLGNRFLQCRPDWLEWCTACNHLQLNQFEAESLGYCIESEEDMLCLAQPILERGVTSVAVTLGARGVLVAWTDEGEAKTKWIEATKVSSVIDPTACGDVFAGAFIVHMLQTGEILASYEFANKVAGLKCTFAGLNGLGDILRMVQGE